MDTAYRLKTDEEEVLAVNRAFFQALESLDVAQMESVWWHEDWVQILHPGWELIVGWEEVRESWVGIFRSTVKMRVLVGQTNVRVVGDAAWISCRPEITYTSEEGFATAPIEVLNIFVRRNGEWRIVTHHAAIAPTPPTNEIVQ